MFLIFILNPRYTIYIKYFLRKLNRKLRFKQFWNFQIGDWHWIKEKTTPIASLNRRLWRLSVPSFSFHFMLALSAIIASFGLLNNSVAIIIGAMIIAPLMGPIVGMAYSIAMGNRKLLNRSSLTVIKGIILTITMSWLTTSIIGLKTIESEILSRTNPTLIDFGIAMAAGSAGAFANTRRSISSALPGVAIAVALVPPLSVVGIALSLGNQEIAIGSSLLFLTNLICIIFFGSLVFLFGSYGNIERAKSGLAMSTAIMFILGVPLTLSMRKMIIKKNVRYEISSVVMAEAETLDNTTLKSVNVIPRKKHLDVVIELAAPIDSLSQAEVDYLKGILSNKIGKPINLEVKIIPIRILKSHNENRTISNN